MHLLIQAIILGVLTGGLYALMTSGLTLTFGTMRIINMAQGVFVVVGAYIAFTLFNYLHIDPFLSILISTPLMFGLGVTLQTFLLRPIRYDAHRLSLLMTWAMAIGIEGILSIFYGTDFRGIITSYQNTSVTVLGYQFPLVRVLAFALSVAVLIGMWLLLSRTKFGRAVRAVSQRESAAKLLGVNTDRTAALAFGVGAATAGAAGAMFGLVSSFDPASHYDLIGRLLAICVLGGLGSNAGAITGAVLLALSESLVQAEFSPAWSSLPFYILLVIVLIARPQGLFGVRSRGAI
ncbi:MAG TPA: branched-chain amino acid ABC transporter permease [Candidatus Dormibacteraeota bacterium]|nr:branched-chain amino acid ABC transporter permease [Candidatus Dormibacteraeota bacterium]